MIHLLHVEDDADIRDIVRLALDLTGGFKLAQCDSGEAALAYLETHTPDLVMLDMMMPGMSGLQALQKMHETPSLREIPALFMTARAQPSEIAELRAAGAAGVICKPFDPVTLGAQIQAAAFGDGD